MIGFRDGYLGLAQNRWVRFDKTRFAGILTVGGTVLGTSRDKPHRMEIDGRVRDMTSVIATNYRRRDSMPWSASGAAARKRTPFGWWRRAYISSRFRRRSTTMLP